MSIRRVLALAILLCAAVAPLRALGAETAQDILDKLKAVANARAPKDMFQRGRMTIYSPSGYKRERELITYAKGYPTGSKDITFFLAPADLRGVAVLNWTYPDRDDDQWTYFPETERVRRINANVQKQDVGDSDFSYEDTKLFNDVVSHSHKLGVGKIIKRHDLVNGVPCTVIEFTPRKKDVTQYGRLILWVDRQDWTIRKIEFYDRDTGLLHKTLIVSDFVTINNDPTPQKLEMVNAKAGTRTVLRFVETRYNQGLSDELFTQRSMRRGPPVMGSGF
jgi:outer membrane lipoprotein-sorting protein